MIEYEGHLSDDRFGELLRLSQNRYARKFLVDSYGDCMFSEEPQKIIVSIAGTRIRGFFRYAVVRHKFYARGTWVSKQERRSGLGARLWHRAISRYPQGSLTLDVVTTSSGGLNLVRSVKSSFRRVLHWNSSGAEV